MTTDTFPKIAIEKIIDNKNKISIYGIAKGSGMIAPNMGTMLAYIFIETALSKNILKNGTPRIETLVSGFPFILLSKIIFSKKYFIDFTN